MCVCVCVCTRQLRKEGTSVARARETGQLLQSTACAPFVPLHPHTRWLLLSTQEGISHAEQVLQQGTVPAGLQTPSENGIGSLLSPVSPSVSALSPQGTLLPMSQWQPDSQVSVCQARDCNVKFAPVPTLPPMPAADESGPEDPTSPTSSATTSTTSSIFGGLTSMLAHPFTARRHHCRACGKIFCSAHSGQNLPLQCASQEQADVERSRLAGTASPLLSLAGLTRRGSTPAMSGSGTASPNGGLLSPRSAAHTSPYFDYATRTSPTSSNRVLDSTVVSARVCDDCHISLTVAASLAGIEISRQALSASGALSPSTAGSPQASQTLSSTRSGPMTASTDSIASRNSRTRQQSGQSTASSSGISISNPVTARSSPPTSQEGSPSTAVNYKPPVKLALPEYRGQTTQVVHKPEHKSSNKRIYQLTGDDSRPLGYTSNSASDRHATPMAESFPSTIGSTPGQGWTWST